MQLVRIEVIVQVDIRHKGENTNLNDDKNYDDIIELEHHVSKKRPRMSRIDRAAQFAPFAALSGHEEAINKTAKIVENENSRR